jgi:hypothetical protein
MATVVPPSTNFEMGRVFGRTFEVIGRNLALYMALAIVLVGLPTLIFQLMMPMAGDQNALRDAILTGAMSMRSFFTMLAIGGLISWIFSSLLQATLVRATIEDLSDRRPNFADCFSTGLMQLVPVIVIAIVGGIGILFASLLLIVPGIMLGVAWSVSVPARVAERTGIFESLSRSAVLTKGHRWKIFFLILITAFVTGFTQNVIVAASSVFGAMVAGVFAAVLAAIASALMATLIAAIYVELRTLKEGTDVSALASVFS